MKIICMVKIVPDVDRFKYDFNNNRVVREKNRMILNPDDVCAVAFALKMKSLQSELDLEVVSMGPESVIPLAEDLIRVGVDRVSLISDKVFSGSDSYATSIVLSEYIKSVDFNCILTGTHAIDGDTAHVPSQVGELLDLCQMSGVIKIDESQFSNNSAVFTVDADDADYTYSVELPAILSLKKESNYKLPYIKYEDANKDVSSNIKIITNRELGINKSQTGIDGSLTKVNRTFIKEYAKKNAVVLNNDENGIDYVFNYLKENGLLNNE